MVNNLATTVQNFVRKIWKLIQLLIVEFLAQKNSNVQHCNTCVILPVNTLRHNDVIINKNHGIFEWRQNTTTARWRCTIVFAMIARTICFENTNCGRTPVVRSVVSPTTVYDGRWFSAGSQLALSCVRCTSISAWNRKRIQPRYHIHQFPFFGRIIGNWDRPNCDFQYQK